MLLLVTSDRAARHPLAPHNNMQSVRGEPLGFLFGLVTVSQRRSTVLQAVEHVMTLPAQLHKMVQSGVPWWQIVYTGIMSTDAVLMIEVCIHGISLSASHTADHVCRHDHLGISPWPDCCSMKS